MHEAVRVGARRVQAQQLGERRDDDVVDQALPLPQTACESMLVLIARATGDVGPLASARGVFVSRRG